ncbi:hydrogenase iron-sulfur subunit [candidate division WOR-3 bacterium]|uniref:Hydrogenase iron-sulfur subunit n=1 Tax=candidate division WOR-3 bacterium TaxID=2052148 RepID=A0A9D5QDD9_UNCW3|nr:hydrogenase iron-sulfur subunit [candidate division WOR-3 bacterium]MBD3365007.1 hydrogenase iron-sulfur subunit [candidate division WOR-3 bacterium]
MSEVSDGENERIGVYVCHCGGNISEVVDVEAVADFARDLPGVVLSRTNEHMCSELGQKQVAEDIAEHKLDRVVIAACSPQFHEKTFRTTLSKSGLNPFLLEMANIREQDSWVHHDEPEKATQKAKDLVAAAVAKARFDTPLDRRSIPIGKRVLVIGGGIAGIQASLNLGDAGFKVYLVEKEPSIGGKMAQLSRTFPTEDCSACILSPKMADVPANPNITLFTNSKVESVDGYLGNFSVKVKQKPTFVDPVKCLCCGACEEVCPVTAPDEFEAGLAQRKAIYVPYDFAVPHKYLIDEERCLRLKRGKDVCGLCIKACPHDAIDFNQKPRTQDFTVDTVIVATGYDTFDATKKKTYGYGRFENVVTALQMERMIVNSVQGKPLRKMGKRIAFVQCVGSRDEQVGNEYCSRICCMYATKMSQLLKRSDPSRDVYVFYTDLRAFGKGFEEYYKRAQDSGVKFVRGRPAELFEDPETKKILFKVEDTLSRQVIETEFDLVVLSTGLVPNPGTKPVAEMLKLAKSPDGFLQEAHPKFKPEDTLTEGVFLAGTVQGPKDIPDTVGQANAAALRAVRLMNQESYSMEPLMAFVDADSCDGCGLCVPACPSGAITLEAKKARINEALCKGCGSCTAWCPRDALDLHCYSNLQLAAQIEVALATKKKNQQRILVFADDMTAYRLADNVGTARMSYSADTRIIKIPSGSRVTPKLMLEAFSKGADGIFIGESEKKSSSYPHSLAEIERNVARVKEILTEAGIEPERIRFSQFVTVMLAGFVKQMNSLADFCAWSGSIPASKRKVVLKDLGEKLFARSGKESAQI